LLTSQKDYSPTSERARPGEGAVQRILDDVARAVIAQTPYQRVVVSLYDSPLAASPRSETRVLKYSARKLSLEDEQEISLFVTGGGIIRGEKFNTSFRLGNSYYIPGDRVPYSVVPRIPSHRRFLGYGGWRADDLLLIPVEVEGRIIGQISVDDPCDGVRPTQAALRGLEELASVAAIALREARVLETLSENHMLFRSLTENTLHGAFIVQGDRFCYVNDRGMEILGYTRQELLVMEPWWQVIHQEDRRTVLDGGGSPSIDGLFEARGVCKNGRVVWLQWTKQAIEYRGGAAILLNLMDISERVRAEKFLKEQALHDPLTGLFNRLYFDETICTELKRSQRYKRPFTVMMTDLAGFKQVNDRLGHQDGDEVLREVARVIQQQIRESDWAVRYGGDEFLIVLPETGVRVEALAQRLHTAVEEWGRSRLSDLPLQIDIGWATWNSDDNQSVPDLIRLADVKMYQAKAVRRGAGKE